MNTKFTTGAVIIALVLSGLSFFGGSDGGPQGNQGPKGDRGNVGAAVGPEFYDTQYFKDNFYVGDGSVASSTDDSATVASAALIDCDIPYVSYTVNGANTTITTQASTSAPFRNMRVGQSCSTLFYSATTTGATTITFAAGTGVDLQEDEGGTVILNGLELARLTFVKKADTDIALVVEPYQVGD